MDFFRRLIPGQSGSSMTGEDDAAEATCHPAMENDALPDYAAEGERPELKDCLSVSASSSSKRLPQDKRSRAYSRHNSFDEREMHVMVQQDEASDEPTSIGSRLLQTNTRKRGSRHRSHSVSEADLQAKVKRENLAMTYDDLDWGLAFGVPMTGLPNNVRRRARTSDPALERISVRQRVRRLETRGNLDVPGQEPLSTRSALKTKLRQAASSVVTQRRVMLELQGNPELPSAGPPEMVAAVRKGPTLRFGNLDLKDNPELGHEDAPGWQFSQPTGGSEGGTTAYLDDVAPGWQSRRRSGGSEGTNVGSTSCLSLPTDSMTLLSDGAARLGDGHVNGISPLVLKDNPDLAASAPYGLASLQSRRPCSALSLDLQDGSTGVRTFSDMESHENEQHVSTQPLDTQDSQRCPYPTTTGRRGAIRTTSWDDHEGIAGSRGKDGTPSWDDQDGKWMMQSREASGPSESRPQHDSCWRPVSSMLDLKDNPALVPGGSTFEITGMQDRQADANREASALNTLPIHLHDVASWAPGAIASHPTRLLTDPDGGSSWEGPEPGSSSGVSHRASRPLARSITLTDTVFGPQSNDATSSSSKEPRQFSPHFAKTRSTSLASTSSSLPKPDDGPRTSMGSTSGLRPVPFSTSHRGSCSSSVHENGHFSAPTPAGSIVTDDSHLPEPDSANNGSTNHRSMPLLGLKENPLFVPIDAHAPATHHPIVAFETCPLDMRDNPNLFAASAGPTDNVDNTPSSVSNRSPVMRLRKDTSSSGNTAASMPLMDSARHSGNSQGDSTDAKSPLMDPFHEGHGTPAQHCSASGRLKPDDPWPGSNSRDSAMPALEDTGSGPWNKGLTQTASMPSLGKRAHGESPSLPGPTQSAGPTDSAGMAEAASSARIPSKSPAMLSAQPVNTGCWSPTCPRPVRTGRNLTAGAIAELLPEPPGSGSLDRSRLSPHPNKTGDFVADALRLRQTPKGAIKELLPEAICSANGSSRPGGLGAGHSQSSSTTTAPPVASGRTDQQSEPPVPSNPLRPASPQGFPPAAPAAPPRTCTSTWNGNGTTDAFPRPASLQRFPTPASTCDTALAQGESHLRMGTRPPGKDSWGDGLMVDAVDLKPVTAQDNFFGVSKQTASAVQPTVLRSTELLGSAGRLPAGPEGMGMFVGTEDSLAPPSCNSIDAARAPAVLSASASAGGNTPGIQVSSIASLPSSNQGGTKQAYAALMPPASSSAVGMASDGSTQSFNSEAPPSARLPAPCTGVDFAAHSASVMQADSSHCSVGAAGMANSAVAAPYRGMDLATETHEQGLQFPSTVPCSGSRSGVGASTHLDVGARVEAAPTKSAPCSYAQDSQRASQTCTERESPYFESEQSSARDTLPFESVPDVYVVGPSRPGSEHGIQSERTINGGAPKVPRLALLNPPADQAREKLVRAKSDGSIRTPKRLISDGSDASSTMPSVVGTGDVSTVGGGVRRVTLQDFYDDVNWDELVFHSPTGVQRPSKQAPPQGLLSIHDDTPKAAGLDKTQGWFIERQQSGQLNRPTEDQERVPQEHEHQQQVPRQPLQQQQPPLQLISGSLRSAKAVGSVASSQTWPDQQQGGREKSPQEGEETDAPLCRLSRPTLPVCWGKGSEVAQAQVRHMQHQRKQFNCSEYHMPQSPQALQSDPRTFQRSLMQEQQHQQQQLQQQSPQLLCQQHAGRPFVPVNTGDYPTSSDKATPPPPQPPPRLQQEQKQQLEQGVREEQEHLREESERAQSSAPSVDVGDQLQQRQPSKQSRGRHISWGDEEERQQGAQDQPEKPQEQSLLLQQQQQHGLQSRRWQAQEGQESSMRRDVGVSAAMGGATEGAAVAATPSAAAPAVAAAESQSTFTSMGSLNDQRRSRNAAHSVASFATGCFDINGGASPSVDVAAAGSVASSAPQLPLLGLRQLRHDIAAAAARSSTAGTQTDTTEPAIANKAITAATIVPGVAEPIAVPHVATAVAITCTGMAPGPSPVQLPKREPERSCAITKAEEVSWEPVVVQSAEPTMQPYELQTQKQQQQQRETPAYDTAWAVAAGCDDRATQTEDSLLHAQHVQTAANACSVSRFDSGGSLGRGRRSSSPTGSQNLTIRGQMPATRSVRTPQFDTAVLANEAELSATGPATEPVAVARETLCAQYQQQVVASGFASSFHGPVRSVDQAFGLESPVLQSPSPPAPALMMDDVCEEGEVTVASADVVINTSNSCLAASSEACSSMLEPFGRGLLQQFEHEHDGATGEDLADSTASAAWPSSFREPVTASSKEQKVGCRATAGLSKAHSWGSSGRFSPPHSPTMTQRTLFIKPVTEWDEKDVVAWIMKISTVQSDFVDLLHSHGITGAVLLTLSEDDMLEMGIEKFGYRRLLLLAAQELRAVLDRQKRFGADFPPEPELVPTSTTVHSPVSGYRVVGKSASIPMITKHTPQSMLMPGANAVMDSYISDPRYSLGTSSASSSIQMDASIANMRQPGMVPMGVRGMPCHVPVVTVTSPVLGHRNINLGGRATSPPMFAPAPLSQSGPCVPVNQTLPSWMSPPLAIPVATSSRSSRAGGTRGRLTVLEDEVKAISDHLKATCSESTTDPTASSTSISARQEGPVEPRIGSAVLPPGGTPFPVGSPPAGSPEPPPANTHPGRQFRRERTDPPQVHQSSITVVPGAQSQGQQVRRMRREWTDPPRRFQAARGMEPMTQAPGNHGSSIRVVPGPWHTMHGSPGPGSPMLGHRSVRRVG